MLELTSHLRPVRDTDQEEPEKEEKPPDERERAYITIRKREGLTEEQARQEFAKFDPGSRFHVRLAARERYAQEEAAAVTAEKQKRDEALSRIPEHYRSDWERRGLSLEEQKAAAKYIPESRLLPEEGKE